MARHIGAARGQGGARAVARAVRRAVPAAAGAGAVTYLAASMVQAGVTWVGWLFGAEFWAIGTTLAILGVSRWTEGEARWARLAVAGALMVGAVAGPLWVFLGPVAALAAAPVAAAVGGLALTLYERRVAAFLGRVRAPGDVPPDRP